MKAEEIAEKMTDVLDVMNVSNTSVSKWERDFIESIQEQLITKKFLSEKQQQILERIWDKI